MSSGLELTPAQLDRLEDALEDLELGPPPQVSPDDPVAERLVEFRELLQLSREAMPLAEVPSGLLDGVMAEAATAAATAPKAAAATPWWSRFKLGVWLPTLAFAGSAALLLVVVLPRSEDDAAVATQTEKVQPAVAADEADAPAPELPRLAAKVDENDNEAADPFAAEGAARGDAVVGERAPDPAPAALSDAIVEDDQGEASRTQPTETRPMEPKAKAKPRPKPSRMPGSGGGSMGKGSGGAMPPSKPSGSGNKKKDEPLPSSRDDDDLWPEVVEGDSLRRGGNCGLAKMRYAKARRADQPEVRARALAGEGLCEFEAGHTGKAKKLFAQARAADPSVSGFIDAQLGAMAPDQAQQADEAPVQTKE